MKGLVWVVLIAVVLEWTDSANIRILVDTESVLHTLNERFLSVAIDTATLRKPKEFKKLDPSSELLRNLGRALAPAYLRFGGTDADFTFFRQIPSRTLPCSERATALLLTEKDWTQLNLLCSNLGFRLLFDFNMVTSRDPETNLWDPENARALLDFSQAAGFSADWQLGNEISGKVGCSRLNGTSSGKDFLKLRSLLNDYSLYRKSIIFGPDIATSHNALAFFQDTLNAGIDALDFVTFHHYYGNGRIAKESDLYDPSILDKLSIIVANYTSAVGGRRPMAIGETSSFYGGGAPGLSDAYGAGFMWLDKLGISARMGVQIVMRQALFQSSYSLLDRDLTPLPDYWLSVLYKRLVGLRVLSVSNVLPDNRFRTYAHCTAGERNGSVTVFFLNLHENEPVEFTARSTTEATFANSSIHWYLLQPYGSEGIKSKNVSLNGVPLRLKGDKLPELKPVVLPPGSVVSVPPLTFGFSVFPEARSSACS